MTVVTVLLFPTVVIYQGWTYYVFRERVRPEAFSRAGGAGQQVPSQGGKPSMPTARPGA